MRIFFANVFVITIVLGASLAYFTCPRLEATDSVDFDIRCNKYRTKKRLEPVTRAAIKVEIICHRSDWNKFPKMRRRRSRADAKVFEMTFDNCSFPAVINLQTLLNSYYGETCSTITFSDFQSTMNRQNFQNFSAHEIKLVNGNFTELPSDLLYDVLNLDSLKISFTQLVHIPEGFFSGWASKITKLDMRSNKLRKITRNNFDNLASMSVMDLRVDLSNNEIEEIDAGAFDSLKYLSTLQLDNNRLRRLPAGLFRFATLMTMMNLSANSFDELPGDLLGYTRNLKEFFMESNNCILRTLPQGFFNNLVNLKSVHLKRSQLRSLPSKLFSSCSALNFIDFSENQLTSLPASLFDNTTNLNNLQIQKNCLENLAAGIFKKLAHLKKLNISRNRLTSLKPEVLDGLQSVDIFNASYNNLTVIDDQFITYLKSATIIDLSNNQLTFDGRGKTESSECRNVSSSMSNLNRSYTDTFENQTIPKLNFDPGIVMKSIDLNNNRILEFNAHLVNMVKYSKSINLCNNRISKINLTDYSLAIVRRNVTDNSGRKTIGYVKVDLKNNPLHCDCHIADFVQHLNGWMGNELYSIFVTEKLKCASPPEFENREIRDISLVQLNCSPEARALNELCNKTCICREQFERHVLSVDCSNRNLTRLPSMIKNVEHWLIELNMTGNMLQHSPSLKDSYLTNVISLDLSHNNITTVTRDLFSPTLQFLWLHGNSISRLDSDVIEYLASNDTSRITLHDNKWACDCEARELVELVQTKSINSTFHEMVCHRSHRKLYNMTVNELCENMIAFMTITSLLIAFFGISIAVSVVLYYKYQREIKIWLYSKQWCLWFVTENELDEDKEYDAFVSFSHKDEDFVEREIVAKLEGGPRPFKLCLHYRDWPPGEWIPVQITRSVAESRRTIIVLTPSFLESVWGLVEFRTAHTHAVKEGRARLIVIIHGDIGNVDDLDQEMKDYLRLNTYIKWGDPWFWDKLRYALPHVKEFPKRKTLRLKSVSGNLLSTSTEDEPRDERSSVTCL